MFPAAKTSLLQLFCLFAIIVLFFPTMAVSSNSPPRFVCFVDETTFFATIGLVLLHRCFDGSKSEILGGNRFYSAFKEAKVLLRCYHGCPDRKSVV